MEYIATGKLPAKFQAFFPIDAHGWFISSEECQSETNVNEYVTTLQNAMERQNSRAKTRKLEADDIDYLVREAVHGVVHPVERAYAYLSHRVTADGGAVANSYGSKANADFLVCYAVPNVGVLCFVSRSKAKTVAYGASKTWRFEFRHPLFGWRTSEGRFSKPIGYKIEAKAREKACKKVRAQARDGIVELPDGTFAGYVEENSIRWVYGPDWDCAFSLVESIGGQLVA